jgi:catalase
VVTGDSAAEVFGAVQQLMAAHRVWERFPASVA